jgi:hypothetical protein
LGPLPNFIGIVFDPTGLRQYLAMFELMFANNLTGMVKNHETSAARSLIQTAYVFHDAPDLSS